MSVHRLICVDAFCDGCNRSFGYDPDIEGSEEEPIMQVGQAAATAVRPAKRLMREHGWKTGRRRDLCPKCRVASPEA